MGWHPFAEIGVNGHQLNTEADPHQKAEKDHPFRAALHRHQQRKEAVPGERHHKRQTSPQPVRQRRQQTGANKQPHKGGGGKSRLIGNPENSRLPGVKNPVGQQPCADIPGLEQVVELEEATEGEQGDKRP